MCSSLVVGWEGKLPWQTMCGTLDSGFRPCIVGLKHRPYSLERPSITAADLVAVYTRRQNVNLFFSRRSSLVHQHAGLNNGKNPFVLL